MTKLHSKFNFECHVIHLLHSILQGHSTIYSGKSLFWQQLFLACRFPEQNKHAFFKMFSFLADYAKYKYKYNCINV